MNMFVLNLIFFILFVSTTISDFILYEIPLKVLYAAVFFTEFLYIFFYKSYLLKYNAGAFFLLIMYLLIFLQNNKSIGFGDVQLSFYCGLYSGFPSCFIAVFISCLMAFFYLFVISIAKKGKLSKIKVPFGPFMLSGCFIAGNFHIEKTLEQLFLSQS